MIILPDRTVSRARVLLPVPAREWRPASQRQTLIGNERQTRFVLTARLHDGALYWRGFFDDRDDADAFLEALGRFHVLGTPIPQEIRRLPQVPRGDAAWYERLNAEIAPHYGEWFPAFGIFPLVYQFATNVFYASGSSGAGGVTAPVDWVSAGSNVDAIGASGNAVAGNNAVSSGAGAGAGAFARSTSVTMTAGVTTYFYSVGTATNDSWFSIASNAAPGVSSNGVLAKAGTSGSTSTKGSGGASASCVGDTKFSGGDGGNGATAGSGGGGGGGGAAGPSGAGSNGTDAINSDQTGKAGGAANNSTTAGGAQVAAATNGNPGASGTEWDGSHGAGSGGSGGGSRAGAGTSGTGGAGGLYGGAPGGGGFSSDTNGPAGAAKGGIVVLTYTPAGLGAEITGGGMMFMLP